MRTREQLPSVRKARRSLKRYITTFFKLREGWPLNLILRATPGIGKTYALIEGLCWWLEDDPDGAGVVVVAASTRKLAVDFMRRATAKVGVEPVALILGRARPLAGATLTDPETTCIYQPALKLAEQAKNAGHLCKRCPSIKECRGQLPVTTIGQVLGMGRIGMGERAFSDGIRIIITTRKMLPFIEDQLGDRLEARVLDDAPPDRDANKMTEAQIKDALERLMIFDDDDDEDPVVTYLMLLLRDLGDARLEVKRGLSKGKSLDRRQLRDYGIRVRLSEDTIAACGSQVLDALSALTEAQGDSDPVLPRTILDLARSGDEAWIEVAKSKGRKTRMVASLHAPDLPLFDPRPGHEDQPVHTLVLDGTACRWEYQHSLRGPQPRIVEIHLPAHDLLTVWSPSESWQPSRLRALYREERRRHPDATASEVERLVEARLRYRLRRLLLRIHAHLLWVVDGWSTSNAPPKLYVVAPMYTLKRKHPGVWKWFRERLESMGFVVTLDHWRSAEGRGLNHLEGCAGLLMFGSPRPALGPLSAYLDNEDWYAEAALSTKEQARWMVEAVLRDEAVLDERVYERVKEDAIAVMDQTAGRPRFPLAVDGLPRLLVGVLPDANRGAGEPRIEEGPRLMTDSERMTVLPRERGARIPESWEQVITFMEKQDLRCLSAKVVETALGTSASSARAQVKRWIDAGLLTGPRWPVKIVHPDAKGKRGRPQTWTALHPGVTKQRILADAEAFQPASAATTLVDNRGDWP